MKNKSVIYFLPVKKEFLNKWVYYNVDYKILTSIYKKVYVCNNFIQLLNHINKVDIIYCWWWNRSLSPLIISKLFNKKIIITGAIHMFDYSGAIDFYKKSFLYKAVTKFVLKYSDVNLFISEDQKQSISSHLKVNNPTLLYSSLNYKTNNDLLLVDKKEILSKQSTLFLSISWLTMDQIKRKNIFLIIDALKIFNNEYKKEWKWVLAGKKDNAYDSILRYIKLNNLSNNIEVLTDISEKQKNQLYLNSNLMIMPSWFEGFGNSVLEAMEYGTPSIVSRYGASPEVVGDSGIIINQMDPEILSKELFKYVNLKNEEKFLMAKKSYIRCNEKFSFESRKLNLKKILMSI